MSLAGEVFAVHVLTGSGLVFVISRNARDSVLVRRAGTWCFVSNHRIFSLNC